uniref:Cytochrome P450 family 4 variant 1 n=1 Tax=Cyphoma gibbosum TaxID=217775 RepID=B3FYF0_CYPGI|nr:cytochrome P450 family 4 variant 1 [Cyphoma gibbosum]
MFVALLLVGIVTIVGTLVWMLQTAKFRQQISLIPGPPTIPLLGNVHQMTTGPGWYKQVLKWGDEFRKQGIFRIMLISKPVIGVTCAETAEVMLNSSKHIDKAQEYGYLHAWLGTGLLTSTGDKWRMRRKMLTPTFHFRILHDFVEVFNQQTCVLIEKLKHHVDKGQFNVFQDIALCALDIICETAMGQHVNAQTKESAYVQSVYKMCGFVEKRMRTPWHYNKTMYDLFGPGEVHDHHLKILHEFTIKVIKDRMSNFNAERAQRLLDDANKKKDWVNCSESETNCRKTRLAFLDMLLFMSDNGKVLSIDDIREEVDTFMFEGHDTTAAGMNWCTYLIGSDEKVQGKVCEELDRVFGNSDRMPTMDDLKELKYLECCIKEAQRLFPSVPYFGRTTTEEAQISSFRVPKDVTVIVFTSAIHRDTRWFPNPEHFDPDRFLPENSVGRHPFAYIPFSAGLRNCIGQKFAMMEEKVILSSIFRNFKVKSCQSREELLPVGELILRPQKGIFIELSAR